MDSSFDTLTRLENEIEQDSPDTTIVSIKPKRKRRKLLTPNSEIPSTSREYLELSTNDRPEITASSMEKELPTSVSQVIDQRFLSILFHQNLLGAAYYDTDNCVLNVFEDMSETDQFSHVMQIFHQTNPDKVIINSKQGRLFVDFLKNACFEDENSKDNIEILPSSHFTFESGKRRLLSLTSITQLPHKATDEHKDIYLHSIINFDNKSSIKAAGALLRYIDSNRIGVELEDSIINAPVVAVAQCSVSASLYLDRNSLQSLQIFVDDNHPARTKRGLYSSVKEGLSLFGQMNRTKSRLGQAKLRHWFRTPSRDSEVISRRQNAIRYFLCDEHYDKCLAFYECLKNIKSVSKIFAKMMNSHISVHEWNVLYKTVYNIVCLIDICKMINCDIEIVEDILSTDFNGLREIVAMINKIMDFDESKIKGKFVVKYGIDDELDEKKKLFHGLPDLMTKVAEQELNDLDSRVGECNVIYLPQLGYLLSMPHYDFIKESENYSFGNLEFMFVNNGIVHYKSQKTKNLDSMLGDTQSEICDHESGIMHRLQNMILQYAHILVKALDFAAEFDCLLSIANFSKDNNLCFPEIDSGKVIRIRAGRHIIYDGCTKQFVPNDTTFDFENGFVKVLSGPNACGKSVYLKQVALIVYMMHLGSPVPAVSAKICICDSIFTRIKCIESVSINLSTFILDLNQVSKAVNSATQRSLIVIDEFGKGTSQSDGVALFISTLRHWLNFGSHCPFILATTHCHSVFKQKLLPATPLLRYQTFASVVNEDESITYLYELVNGICIHSQANFVAKNVGISSKIVGRANELLSNPKSVCRNKLCLSKVHRNSFEITEKFFSVNLEDEECLHEFLSFIQHKSL